MASSSCSKREMGTGALTDEMLLHHLLQYPVIYKKSHPHYKSINIKNNCWQELERLLNVETKQLKAQFKALKEKFRREAKIAAGRSGDAAAATPRWGLFNMCQMLFDGESDRETTSNLSIESQAQEEDEDEDEDIYHVADRASIDTQCSGTPSTSSMESQPPTRKRKVEATPSTAQDKVLHNIAVGTEKFVERREQRKVGSNARITNFLSYLGSELEVLPSQDSEIFMDLITSQLLDVKKAIRDRNE